MDLFDIQKKRLSILGSTGSIGVQTLDVAQRLGLEVTALAARSSVTAMEEKARRFRPRLVAMREEAAAADLRLRLRDLPIRVSAGIEGVCEAASLDDVDMVLSAAVGMEGLRPTMAAIEAGRDVALANKETLVAGGAVVLEAAERRGVRLLPVDSEHSAIFQCLQGAPPNRALRKVILTASGGPFFGRTAAELERVTLEDALKHPNWSMGAKITIDCATMMNKGLELIEARWLFDVAPENIDIVVHRESVVHSLIEYGDGSVLAQLGLPDMRLPIQYALTWPYRVPSPVKELSLTDAGRLTFYPPDEETFVCLGACRRAIVRGGLAPAAVNAANERAVELFRGGQIGFADIGRLVCAALEIPLPAADGTLEQILDTDRMVRERTAEAARKMR